MRKVLTLCLVHESPRILLGMKKRGFGSGRWNGFGGKVEPGETIEQAAHRELKEEAGIAVTHMEKAGELLFEFVGDPVRLEIHVFRGHGVIGEPIESDEMRPQWYTERTLPYEQMWADDVHWFPYFLAGTPFEGTFVFEGELTILRHEVRERVTA
jgi:8-oxo-dGTP diphosphatase/2-hydroxy-dATP diphosphatase